jgi:hypothetical protein
MRWHLLRDLEVSNRRMPRNGPPFHQPHVCRRRTTQKACQNSGAPRESMSDSAEIQKTGAQGVPANVALNEAAWQKWVNKNKERDAARRIRLIRVLWLVLPLLLACVVVWWASRS